jgi:hypothetical protein
MQIINENVARLKACLLCQQKSLLLGSLEEQKQKIIKQQNTSKSNNI